MKDPTRLLDSPASETELRLLRAAISEEPPPAAVQRLALALGLPAEAPATLAPAASDAATGLGTAATQLTALTIGASILAAGSVVWFVTSRPPAAELAPRRPVPAALAPAVSPIAPQATRPPPLPAASDTAERAQRAAAAEGPATGAAPEGRGLAQEIAAVDAARQLLASGQAREALAALARYARAHPTGALRQEATLLEIEAWQRAGERARARKLARAFLADNPGSPHAQRIRALILAGNDAR
jgi:hypothetical protein